MHDEEYGQRWNQHIESSSRPRRVDHPQADGEGLFRPASGEGQGWRDERQREVQQDRDRSQAEIQAQEGTTHQPTDSGTDGDRGGYEELEPEEAAEVAPGPAKGLVKRERL